MIFDNPNDIGFLFCPNADLDANERASPISIGKAPLVSFLPQTPNGRILVTSRNLLAGKTLVRMQHNIIRVEPMNEKDAMKLLQTRIPFGGSTELEARALVRALECIPLAITQAAAYTRVREPRIMVSTYL